MTSTNRGWRTVSAKLIRSVTAASLLTLGLTFAVGGSPANAATSADSLRLNNDNRFSAYVKAGESVKMDVSVGWLSASGAGKHTISLIDTNGTVRDTCTIAAGAAVGAGCSVSATSTTTGVWWAVVEVDATSYGGFSDPAPLDGSNQTQHIDWTLNVLDAGGAPIPGRVWDDGVYTAAQRFGNRSAAALRSFSKDLTFWYLDDSGWLYEATQTAYNGVYSQVFSNHLGGIDPATGLPFYHSNQVLGNTLDFTGAGNPMYKLFFERPAADLPATSTWPDGSTRTLDNSDAPLMPAFTTYSYARTGTASDAGTLTYALSNYVGTVDFTIDSNLNGVADAGDVKVTDVYNGSTDTITWDGKDAGGSLVPVSKEVKVWASVARTGEIHWVTRDAEMRDGLQVNRLNGPAAGRPTIYWDDTNLTTDDHLNLVSTSNKDGSAGVDSTGGVHDLPPSTVPDGFWGWGNNRFINDWTYVPIDVSKSLLIEPLNPDVRIVKELVSETPLHAGDPIVWKVSITNLGNVDATGVSVADLLPSNVTGDAATLTNPSKGTVAGTTWTVGTLGVNAVETVEVHGTINADATGTVTNYASVNSTEDPYKGDPKTDCQDNTDLPGDTDQCDVVTVPLSAQLPDLRIVKNRAGSGTVAPGDTVTYDVAVDNAGPGKATNVTLSDLADAGLTGVTLTNPSKGSVSGTTWNIGELAAGEKQTITVTATVDADATGTLVNYASVSSTEDPYTGNPVDACQDNATLAGDTDQCDQAPVTLADPDLRIVKTRIGSGPVKAGDPVSYTVSAGNLGRGNATNVTVTDLFPTKTHDGVLTSPSKGTVAGADWSIGTLAPNETQTVTVTVTVDAGADGTITNYATVGSDELPYTGDPKTDCQDNTDLPGDTDQCDLVPVTVGHPHLVILKSLDTPRALAGETAKWTVTIKNTGNVREDDVSVSDTPPAGTHDGAFSAPSKGTANGLLWNVGTLAPNEVASVTFTAVINADAEGTLLNTAVVQSPLLPPPGGPGKCEDNTTLDADTDQCDEVPLNLDGPHLRIVKSVAKPLDDGTVMWTVKIGNDGPGYARDVTVTDTLPASTIPGSVQFIATDRGTFDTATGLWTVGGLAKGETAGLVFSTRHTHAALLAGVRNIAIVDAPKSPPTGTVENCQSNSDLPGDTDQCDDAEVKIPPTPPVIDSGVPVIGGLPVAEVVTGGVLLASGAGLATVLLLRRRKTREDGHQAA